MDTVNGISALSLARVQFAANMTFHILFPTITIALGWVLVYFRLRHNHEVRDARAPAASHQSKWMDAYRFWIKVFALSFAIGVVTGVTMSFQFGTNWPGYMNTVGNIAGPFLAYEILTAFFMEATFLSVLLFGMNRVSNRIHTLATVLVAVGTTLSAFWILALNSWMQTPAGFVMRDGVAHATSWSQVLFNPSMPYRITHMLLACGITVTFLLMGVSAYRWLRGDRGADVIMTLRTGAFTAAVLLPLQIVAGDLHGLNTLHYQPAKVAAMEGLWQTTNHAPAVLFAWPDEAMHRNRYEIAIPNLASLYLTHGFTEAVPGLDEFGAKHPPVAPVFFAFRIMVGMGLLMLAVAWTAAWQLRIRRPLPNPLPQAGEGTSSYSPPPAREETISHSPSLAREEIISYPPPQAREEIISYPPPLAREEIVSYPPPLAGEGREGALSNSATISATESVHKQPGELQPWLARVLVLLSFAGWIALVAGWYVTEIGRQPYLVYGVLLAADAAAPIARPMLGFTLGMYLTLYAVLLVSYISVVFYMARNAHSLTIAAPLNVPVHS